MSKPASQPDPRRQPGQTQAANPPGIINDLQGGNPPAGNQSMIINDLYPAGTALPQQQMIVNDVPAGAGRAAGQQMVVNDGRLPQNAGGPQQMIVNDMAFSDLVKGLEALTKGELPPGAQMIVNDTTGRTAASGAPGATRPAQPGPARQPVPGNPAVQAGMQQVSRPMQPQQAVIQRPMPQPNVAQQQIQMPRQAGQVDPRLAARQQAQPQPMVINTPQPLVKPRREEVGSSPQAAAATPFRIIQEDSPRSGMGQTNPPVGQLAAPPRAERKPAGAAKKSAQKSEPSKGKIPTGEEWKGSYAGRTMMPSLLICSGLSAALVWLSLRFLPQEWLAEILMAGLGAIWAMQLVRWGYRVWLFRYRLTAEHLYLHRGLLYGRPVQVPRCEILKISVSANLVEKILGVGKIVIESQPARDGKPSTVELEGVRSPTDIVQKIGQKKSKAG